MESSATHQHQHQQVYAMGPFAGCGDLDHPCIQQQALQHALAAGLYAGGNQGGHALHVRTSATCQSAGPDTTSPTLSLASDLVRVLFFQQKKSQAQAQPADWAPGFFSRVFVS
jgi:hypothetical protein